MLMVKEGFRFLTFCFVKHLVKKGKADQVNAANTTTSLTCSQTVPIVIQTLPSISSVLPDDFSVLGSDEVEFQSNIN